MNNAYDVVVVGGAGHVGAPLSIVLASRGLRTLIHDLNEKSLVALRAGTMPFLEDGAEPLLRAALKRDAIGFSSSPDSIRGIPNVIVTIGTPIDEFQNPSISLLTRCMDTLTPFISDDQLIVLRSTVAPGVTEHLGRYLEAKGKRPALAFCPERVVQGKGVEEIQSLPQMVSGTSRRAVERASALFERIAPEVVEMTPREAEYAKLISNAYRYIQFAATNQFYMMVEADGLDYNRLVARMKDKYPRMAGFPGAGFAAGPCLMKDTMQLFAFRKHDFILGQVAMTINEGMPNYLVAHLAQKTRINGTAVGILGMAFKSESDDIRDSLSYKLKKILEFQGAHVSCSDEYVRDESFISREELIQRSQVVIVGVPHDAYRGLETLPHHVVVDVWGVLEICKRVCRGRERCDVLSVQMISRKQVGVGVVGPRFGGKVHIPAFRADERCHVVALAGRDSHRTAKAADALQVERSYGDWRDLVGDSSVDVVSIAVPPLEQPAIIAEASRRGKHVFCEKPLAATMEAAERSLECVRRAGVVHAMDFIFPEIETWRSARDLIADGAIGAVRHFSYRWCLETFAQRHKGDDSWKSRTAEGGGAVGSFLPHVIFNIEWMLGAIAGIDSVRAREVDDKALFCDCVVYLATGIHGRISISTDSYLGCGHEIEIFGDAGTLVLRNPTPNHHADGFELSVGTRASGRLEVVKRDPLQGDIDGRIAPVRRIVGRFIDAVCGGGGVTPNLEDGLRVQRWLQTVVDGAS